MRPPLQCLELPVNRVDEHNRRTPVAVAQAMMTRFDGVGSA